MNTEPLTQEARHPIAVVAERTGLSQDVLRVWERRYAVVSPARGAGGQRLYSDDDIARLRLLRNATDAGRPISQVASLGDAQLQIIASEDTAARQVRARDDASTTPLGAIVARAMVHTVAMDERALDIELCRAAAEHGVPAFVQSLAAPLLERIGDDWTACVLTAAQKHLAVGVIQSVMMNLLRSIAIPADARRFVIASLAGERHGIGALVSAIAAALEGWRVVMLGDDLVAPEIASAVHATGAHAVAINIGHLDDRTAFVEEVQLLQASLPDGIPLFAGGAGARQLQRTSTRSDPGIVVFKDLDTLRAALREMAG